MDALVVGAGTMGQWAAAVLRELDDDAAVTFLDRDEATAREAAEIHEAGLATNPQPEDFSLVCIAVPIPAAREAIATYSECASDAVLDVTGTMTDPVAAMAEHAPELERASLHPLFAPRNEPGNVAVVIDRPGPTTDRLVSTLELRRNTVFETTPAEHDEAMETVQARVHAAILAYGIAAEPVPSYFQTPISRAMTDLLEQVTAGEGAVYAEIQAAFDGAGDVAAAAEAIASADRDEFQELFERAQSGTDSQRGE